MIKKVLVVINLIFAFGIAGLSQETNVHVGIGTDYAIIAGMDYSKNKHLVAVDVKNFKICKVPGGCGRQTSVRGLYAHKVKDTLYIQGGVSYDYYKVPLFDKSAVQAVVGIRKTAKEKDAVVEFNYNHDLTSENKVRTGEVQGTLYLPKHIFVRGNMRVRRFQDFYKNGRTDVVGQVYLGFYF